MKNLVLAILLLLIPVTGRAQMAGQPACATRTVAVSVTGRDGRPLLNLTPGNFHAKTHGKTLQIVSARMASPAGRTVLVLDESPSLWGQQGWRRLFAGALADDFLTHQGGGRQIAFVGFGSKINAEASFTMRPASLLRLLPPAVLPNVKSPPVHGQTALWDTLASALTLFGRVQPGDAVYVITDGRDDHSEKTSREVTEEYQRQGIRLFGFLSVEPSSWRLVLRSPEEPGPDGLAHMTRETGGGELLYPYGHGLAPGVQAPPEYAIEAWFHYWPHLQFPALRPVLNGLYGRMFDEYLLEIRLPKPSLKTVKWKLELAGIPGKTAHDLVLDYPRELAACTAN
jgi:hypothetical protein